VDIAGDLATLKENLAKFKKGKMKGLEDIDINELDWVRFFTLNYQIQVRSSPTLFDPAQSVTTHSCLVTLRPLNNQDLKRSGF
jgi:hypothetical protein